MDDYGASLIKISLTAVEKYLDTVLYRVNDRLFNIRLLNLVTITVANEKGGFIFICHDTGEIKKRSNIQDEATPKNT